MATIRKRGKTWHVQIRQANKPSMTKSFTKKLDAVRWAQNAEGMLREDKSINLRRDNQIPLRAAIQKYIETVSKSKKGCKEEIYRLQKISCQDFSGNLLSRITSSQIAHYRDLRLATVSSATVRRELTLLRHLFNIAKKEWGIWVPENPISAISIPSCSPPRERRVSDDELRELEKAAGKKSSIPLAKIIRFAVLTGMRKSEILGIRPEHVIGNGTLLIPSTKNGRPRIIPLHNEAEEILVNEGGNFKSTSAGLRMAFDRARKKAKLNSVRFHDLRHEAISRFFESGLSIPEVMKISGHSDVRMLMRYTHPKAHEIAKKLVQVPRTIALDSVLFSQEIELKLYYACSDTNINRSEYLLELQNQMEKTFGFPPSLSIIQAALSAFKCGFSVDEFLAKLEQVSGLKKLEC